MYTAANHSSFMVLMTTVMSFLVFVVSANAVCNPIPTINEIPGSDKKNFTLTQRYDIEFSSAGGGIHTCGPTIFKCANSSSLMLKSLTIKTKKMIKFEQFIVVGRPNQGDHAISFGGWNIPRSYGGTDYVYTYTPETLLAGNGSLGVEATVVISSLTAIPPKETTVEILFQCLKIDPPAILPSKAPEENGTFMSLFLIYVLPVVIFFLLFMMSIIRRCNPYAMAKLKNWGGFTAKDEEEIRNHAGGGTWLDNVDEIITDLKSRGVHEKRADKEEEEMKGMADSDDDSMSSSGTGSGSVSGSDPISATKDSASTSNSEASHSMESAESRDENTEDDNTEGENSGDVNSVDEKSSDENSVDDDDL